MKVEPITWDNHERMGRTRVLYDNVPFEITVTQTEVQFEDETPGFIAYAFSFGVQFAFGCLENALLTLSSLCGILQRNLSRAFQDASFSSGMFVISPIRRELSLDEWISDSQFQVSVLLKSREKIFVNFYPSRAEVIFPQFEITGKVAHYLKGILLNYYF